MPTSTQIVIIQRTAIRIRTFSIHEEQRPTTSLCHEQKDDRREWNEFILRRRSTSCRTRDGNKMWNCKLCVGRIGPWTVVAVDHASRGPGLKGRELSPIARVDPSLNQERKREREKIERERVVEDLNARSSDRTTFELGVWASKELEICYVMSDDHSPVNMKKDFFGSNCRGEGEWFGGRSSLDKEVLRGLVARFWLEEEARSWTIVGMGHSARNIKRGIKETAVTYATRKSSSEKLHPSPTRNLPLQLGLSYISMTLLEYREHIFVREKLGNSPPFLFFFTSLLYSEKNYDEIVIERNKQSRIMLDENRVFEFSFFLFNESESLFRIYTQWS